VRPDLREPPLREVGVALVQLAGDRELEDAVAEELEALVGGRAVDSPRRVRKDLPQPLARQRLDQLPEIPAAAASA